MISTEEKLKKLLQGFEVFIFDPDSDKSGIVSQKLSGKRAQEIDGVAFQDNILILISIYDGNREPEIDDKIKPYFRDLNYLDNIDHLNLVVANAKSPRGKSNQEWINNFKKEMLNSSNEFIVIKLFFCPNLYVPIEKVPLQSDESIIDKKNFNYFEYAIDNIGYTHTERELFFFLKIKKRCIGRRKGSRVGDEPELLPEFDAIETNLSSNQKMYSACVAVSDIIEYVQILRLANEYDLKAFQRMVNGDRIRRISNNYLSVHEIFPNNIILAFNPELYNLANINHFILRDNDRIKIKFYKEFGSLIIIDGQHRLLAHLLDPYRDIDKPILINVILFLDKEGAYDQMAELFYTINTQQKRLVSLVSLRLRSKLNPGELESIWYKVFDRLNALHQDDNYIYNKIYFEEKELREDRNKLSIVSVVKYAGLKSATHGVAKKHHKSYLGLKDLGDACVNESYGISDFYQNFIRKYFGIIGEILKNSGTVISARDLGGLLRLIIHFINHTNTKGLFIQLSKERGEIPSELKQNIKNYLSKIPFSRLLSLEYGANEWRSMEGFFLGCIRKQYKGFGFGNLLSEKGEIALKRGKKF